MLQSIQYSPSYEFRNPIEFKLKLLMGESRQGCSLTNLQRWLQGFGRTLLVGYPSPSKGKRYRFCHTADLLGYCVQTAVLLVQRIRRGKMKWYPKYMNYTEENRSLICKKLVVMHSFKFWCKKIQYYRNSVYDTPLIYSGRCLALPPYAAGLAA